MNIKSAEFVSSYVDWKKCPSDAIPEYAFIGRSNVGKSSLINYLTGRTKLAKISRTPGKTQCINHFIINEGWHLVDLPGYGYVKIGQKNSKKWLDASKAYLRNREQLVYVFQLIDCRIAPQKRDLDFINWMGENQIPFVIVFTKNDHPKETKVHRDLFQKKLLKHWEELPITFITSSSSKKGGDAILDFIAEMNVAFRKEI